MIKDFIIGAIPTIRLVSITLSALDANEEGLDDEASRQGLALANALQAYVDSFPQGVLVAKGYAQIKAFCDSTLNSIEAVAESVLSKSEKVKAIQTLLADLTDDTKVFQLKKGKDFDYLQKTIVTAKVRLSEVKEG